jgi:hypothetical protein
VVQKDTIGILIGAAWNLQVLLGAIVTIARLTLEAHEHRMFSHSVFKYIFLAMVYSFQCTDILLLHRTSSPFCSGYFEIGPHEQFAQAGLRPGSSQSQPPK